MTALWARLSLYATALAAGGAFSIIFTGESYGGFEGDSPAGALGAWAVMTGAALVAALVGSAGRYRFVLILPATVLYTLVAVYGSPPVFSPAGWRGLFWQIVSDVYSAGNTMYAEPVPYDLAPGLFVVLIPVVMVVVAFAVSATLYEESPVISVSVLGLTIGVLSTIAFEDGAGPFFAVFLAAAVSLLLATGTVGGAGRPGWPGVAAGIAVVALVLALPKAPLADRTVSAGLIDWTRIGAIGTSRLDVQADVGDYLTVGRDVELMRIRSPEPLLWRGGTLDYFDGFRWSDTTRPGEDYGEEISPYVETRPVLQSVQVLNAQTDLIFGGYEVSRTSLNPEDVERKADGSWVVDEPLAENSYYRVLSEIPQPTTAQLQAAGTSYPAGVREKYLQLPDNLPNAVSGTARKIQNRYNPTTPYETARAIERYLIYDGGFVYNLEADYRRADRALEEFLAGNKEGFCTQFATSMALIARDLGIPSRVVYGATSGEEVEPGEYVVTGRNMHTWVEIYFPGVGWYPFDPTPGFSMPSAMEQNAPRPEAPISQRNAIPNENPNLDRRAQAGAENREQPNNPQKSDASGRSPGSGERLPVWPLYALVPVLLVAAVPLSKRALLARGRPEDLYHDLSGRLRDALPPGMGAVTDSPALTPTERMLLLAGALGLEESPYRGFAHAYSEHLYAGGRRPGARHSVAVAYRRALREYGRLPLWRRVLAAANPASLLARAGKKIAGARAGVRKALRGAFRRRP